jgi:hypothetical protein
MVADSRVSRSGRGESEPALARGERDASLLDGMAWASVSDLLARALRAASAPRRSSRTVDILDTLAGALPERERGQGDRGGDEGVEDRSEEQYLKEQIKRFQMGKK